MKLFFIRILFFIVLFNPLRAQALEEVTLQLKWTHAFQFAGYYVALEKGFYKEAGLDVTILEATPGIDPIEKVLNGDAHFGVGTSSLLLSRQDGKPLKVLSVIFQHSPQVLITNPLTAREGLKNISTKRIMIELQADEILAYLKKQNIPLEKLNLLEHSFDPQDLIENRVDAMSAYVTNETWFLGNSGINYNIFTPRSLGIDFYGDNLFTSEQLLTDNVELVENFRDASLKGWKYAMSNIDEVADLIHDKYSDKLPVEFYKYEAHRMEELMQPELIEIGYMNTNRWQHIADTYIDLGLLSKDFNYKELIYSRDYKTELSQAYKLAAIVIVLLILVGFIVLYIYRIQIQLKEKNEKLQQQTNTLSQQAQVIGQTHDSVISTDMDGYILTWNHGSEVLLEYKENEVIGKHISMVHREEDLEEFSRSLEVLMQTGGYTSDAVHVKKSKENVWVSLSLSLIRDETGTPVQMIGYAQDITKRHELDKELKATHNMLSKLTQHMPGVATQFQLFEDGHATFPYASNGFMDIYGVTPEEARKDAQQAFKNVHPDDLDMLGVSIQESAKNMTNWHMKYRVNLPHKGLRWIEGTANPEKLEDGSILWHGYLHDITEDKRKDKLMIAQSRNAAMGEMIGMIAHQWRQPLAAISMSMNNMLADIDLEIFDTEIGKSYAKEVINKNNHLSHTIDDFRNFFQPDKELSKLKLQTVIEETYSIVKDSLINNNIELKTSYESESEIDIYPRELMQVFLNIINNAKDVLLFKHINKAFIEIKIYERDNYIITDIEDNGKGIGEKILPKIFDPYFSTKDEKNGTGLGLYMSKMIVENHLNGKIEAFNTEHGACFRVILQKS